MASLVDDGAIKTTQTKVLNGLSAVTLKETHSIIEKAAMIGKLVIKF